MEQKPCVDSRRAVLAIPRPPLSALDVCCKHVFDRRAHPTLPCSFFHAAYDTFFFKICLVAFVCVCVFGCFSSVLVGCGGASVLAARQRAANRWVKVSLLEIRDVYVHE